MSYDDRVIDFDLHSFEMRHGDELSIETVARITYYGALQPSSSGEWLVIKEPHGRERAINLANVVSITVMKSRLD